MHFPRLWPLAMLITTALCLAPSRPAVLFAEPLPTVASMAETSSTEGAEIRWQPYTGTALDGSPLDGELGRIRVPENRRRPGKTLELAFVRFRTRHPNPGPPIFFLAGGPGGSGVEGAATVATHPQVRLLEHSDVIGVDQRGTGRSLGDLAKSVTEVRLPMNRAIDRAELVAAIEIAARDTVAYWRERGVDLAAYNSVESAEDLEAVRKALGLEKIVLYGTSYGSHLGLSYLRRHGEHVARAVFSKVEGPNHTFKLPSVVQSHLEHLGELLKGDPALSPGAPDLLATVRALLQELAIHPVTTSGPEEEKDDSEVTVGALDLQIELSRALASARSTAALPAMLHRFESGNWRELAETARDTRRVRLPAMALMMDCSSGATPRRWQRLEEERNSPDNILGDAILAPFYPEACAAAGRPDLGDAFRATLASNVPVLFTSGTLDVRTPPENVEEILSGFPNGVHVVVDNAGHEGRELMSPEYRDLLQAFLRGEQIRSSRITLPEPIFESISQE